MRRTATALLACIIPPPPAPSPPCCRLPHMHRPHNPEPPPAAGDVRSWLP